MRKIEISANSQVSTAACVCGTPTLKVYQNGAEINNIVGVTESSLIGLLNKVKNFQIQVS